MENKFENKIQIASALRLLADSVEKCEKIDFSELKVHYESQEEIETGNISLTLKPIKWVGCDFKLRFLKT